MNKLIDQLINCLHWFDMFVPGRKDHIDWKHVGQMRSRLVKMRFADKATTVAIEPMAKTAPTSNSSMLVNFRTMNGKARDRQALSRWYSKECITTKEKELSARIEETRRSHEARQTAGALPAITEEEAEAVYEIQQPQMSRAAEDKLADFLSGTTDDINEILFTSLSEAPVVENTTNRSSNNDDTASTNGLASKFRRLSRTSKPAPSEAVSNDMEVIAALEQAAKLDATASPAQTLEPISLPIETYLEAESSTDDDHGDDSDDNGCANIAEARKRKVVSLKSRSRR